MARVIKTEIVGRTIKFIVADAGTLSLHLDNVSTENQDRGLIHGFIQRVADAAAMERDPDTGKPATPEAKFAAMQQLVDHYNSGSTEWSTKRSGGGNEGGLLVRCLAEIYTQKTREELTAWVKARTAAEKTKLLNEGPIAEIAARIRAEATAGIDTGSLLATL